MQMQVESFSLELLSKPISFTALGYFIIQLQSLAEVWELKKKHNTNFN